MSVNCIILKTYPTKRGIGVILDFPINIFPQIGRVLKKGEFTWKIIGTSPPISLNMLSNKDFYSQYNSEVIWDCVIEPIGHLEKLKDGDIVETE